MEMTAMTFNLRYPTPKDGDHFWPNRVDRVVRMIRKHDPLVMGTQEGYLSMLTDLELHLPDYEWFGFGRFGEHENEHNAIFVKRGVFGILEQGQFWLSETPDEAASMSWDSHFPRICTWMALRHLETGSEFAVYNTHLDHAGQEARNRGVRIIARRMDELRSRRGIPALLMGDFNSYPGQEPILYLRGQLEARPELTDAYVRLAGRIGMTAHDFRGGEDGEPIDYIFATPEWDILRTEVDRSTVDGGYPSDHYPIIVRLKLGRR
jgi:endonuclease/exonuclease/phosphatase family metal-dependent hydrolase